MAEQTFAHGRSLVIFFVLAFMIAWAPWGALLANPLLPPQVSLIGLAAPAAAAVLASLLASGLDGPRRLLQRLVQWRFPAPWWIASLIFMPAVYGLAAVGSARLYPDAAPVALTLQSPAFVALSFVWLIVITAGEEIGWRGYALPLLLEMRVPPTVAALGLGLAWGVWHIPIYVLSRQFAFPWLLFLAFTCLLSIVYLLLYLHSGGSLLPALLLHATTDLAPRVISFANLDWRFWSLVDLILFVVATLIVATRYFNGVRPRPGKAALGRSGETTI
jgi:membrane protease YdiL (CAAX protease family)